MDKFRIDIKKAGIVTNSAYFSSIDELNAWLEAETANGSFGENFTYQIDDTTEEFNTLQLRIEMKAKGERARRICEECLDIIAGFNIDRALTGAQITQMQSQFGTIEAYLKANRPMSAKPLIQALIPDEDLITTQMKELVLAVLSEV